MSAYDRGLVYDAGYQQAKLDHERGDEWAKANYKHKVTEFTTPWMHEVWCNGYAAYLAEQREPSPLRDLLERVRRAASEIGKLEYEADGREAVRLSGKLEGLNLVRSYIEEALR